MVVRAHTVVMCVILYHLRGGIKIRRETNDMVEMLQRATKYVEMAVYINIYRETLEKHGV